VELSSHSEIINISPTLFGTPTHVSAHYIKMFKMIENVEKLAFKWQYKAAKSQQCTRSPKVKLAYIAIIDQIFFGYFLSLGQFPGY